MCTKYIPGPPQGRLVQHEDYESGRLAGVNAASIILRHPTDTLSSQLPNTTQLANTRIHTLTSPATEDAPGPLGYKYANITLVDQLKRHRGCTRLVDPSYQDAIQLIPSLYEMRPLPQTSSPTLSIHRLYTSTLDPRFRSVTTMAASLPQPPLGAEPIVSSSRQRPGTAHRGPLHWRSWRRSSRGTGGTQSSTPGPPAVRQSRPGCSGPRRRGSHCYD